MKLEDAIKQNRFNSEKEKAIINIFYTSGYLNNFFQSRFKEHNLTRQQYNVLRILRGSHPTPLSTKEITSRMIDKMSDSPKIVDRLCSKKLVIKETCPDDKRLVDIRITNEGLKLLEIFDKLNNQYMQTEFSLSKEECKTLNNLLDKIRVNELTNQDL